MILKRCIQCSVECVISIVLMSIFFSRRGFLHYKLSLLMFAGSVLAEYYILISRKQGSSLESWCGTLYLLFSYPHHL